ncbi:sarcospan isoform X2 [Esox lucius]|uniref:sarcospan isoform X2 n=1 Tax=Esox lucius TaxID=8010 RepID=UPI001476F22A|nr:sarcospan isoform X2 [Esox lucius]
MFIKIWHGIRFNYFLLSSQLFAFSLRFHLPKRGVSCAMLRRRRKCKYPNQLCLVSFLGFLLYCITYLPDEKTSMQFIAKLLYFILCTVGLVISVLVVAFSGHHYAQTNGFNCLMVGNDCVCTLDPQDPIARTFTYAEVSDCEEVTVTLKLYFLIQITLNLAQALVCALGAFVMWKHRYQVFFAGLQIRSASTQHWQKV